MKSIREELQKRGLKYTPQRVHILRVLEEGKTHLSPEEILAQVKKRFPRIGQATVYRNLELLSRAGIVQKADWGERHLHYELRGESHHHLICTLCGRIEEFAAAPLKSFSDKISRRYGFIITQEEIRLFGICSKCR